MNTRGEPLWIPVSVLVLATSGCGPSMVATRADNLAELVRAERAFAAMAMESGQRAAWLRWFAPAGLMYRQGRFVNARQFMEQGDAEPPPADPGVFDWRPAYGDVARSGDLGYSSGPVRIIELGRSDRYFFSVWRKQADGTWRVVLDLGNSVTFQDHDPFDDPYVAAQPVAEAVNAGPATDLRMLDRDSLTSARALAAVLDPSVRGLRWRAPIILGQDAFLRVLRDGPDRITHVPEGGELSAAGDMGYTYGRYQWGSPPLEQGVYARMWRRDAAGHWKVVYDVARPDAPGRAP